MNTVEKIDRLLLDIETSYPELYQFLDEVPVRFTTSEAVVEGELQDYLDSLQQKLTHYKQMNKTTKPNKTMKTYDHLQLHQEHGKWDSDVKMWMEDIKIWKEEMVALTEALRFIEEAVHNHKSALKSHSDSILFHQNELQHHERDMRYVLEGSNIDRELLGDHQKEAARHALQFNAHERLKRYHHSVMTLTKSLKMAIASIE